MHPNLSPLYSKRTTSLQGTKDLSCTLFVFSTDPQDSTDRAIIASTLHSAHEDIVNNLNFNLIYPLLNTAKVTPVQAVPQLMRPLVPDNHGAQVNNLIMYLCNCRLEEFKEFIRLVRESASEGGAAHVELAQILEKHLNYFESPGSF